MKKIILAFILFCNIAAYAQQDPLFTQYMYNKLLINPAYAGNNEQLSVDLLNRTQWVGIDGAPETFTISAHSTMRNRNVGLGIYLYRDVLGPQINQGIMGTYAYRLYLSRGTLAFGLQFGLKYFDFDWNAMVLKDPDYLFDPQEVKRVSPDANFGIYYQSSRMFFGVSSKQLLQNDYGYIKDSAGKSSFSKLTQHFYMMGGFAVPLKDKIIFRPSMLAKYTPNTPLQLDLNASVLFSNIFWVGVSYRTANAISFLTEFKIADRLKLGYSFDLYLNELQPFNYGSHEIRLGFELPLYETRMKTPRYF